MAPRHDVPRIDRAANLLGGIFLLVGVAFGAVMFIAQSVPGLIA